MRPAVAFWSGGKDSALALDRIRRAGEYDVRALITTVNATYGRVSMHGVREELIDRQSAAIGIPVHKMYVDGRGGNDDYVPALRDTLQAFKAQGVRDVIFGDIFLEDLRQWREGLLRELDMHGVFPLWKENTRGLVQEFMTKGFKAVICCTNDADLEEAHVGKSLDAAFVAGLPAAVDPCGENGEYHSFVHDGPIFLHPVDFTMGETVYRPLQVTDQPDADHDPSAIPLPATSQPMRTKGFWFVDLLDPATARS